MTISRLPANLPKLLRDAGLKVVEIDGWQTRGRPLSTGGFAPVGVLNHHTGAFDGMGDAVDDLAYARWMFLTGRRDLPAPLCNLSISAEGVVYVGAAGRANHAGTAKASGTVAGGDGNRLYVGIEWMLSGTQAIPKVMYNAGVVVNAVLTKEVLKTSVQTISCHYQTSVTGKWDIGDPSGIPFNGKKVLDVAKFRARVAVARRETVDFDWFQPGKVGSPQSALVLGVRKSFGHFVNETVTVGSAATGEGGGIRMRPILRAGTRARKTAGFDALPFSVVAGHAPPPRASKARAAYMKAFNAIRGMFKGGDLNLARRAVMRITGRAVVGHGALWLVLPRTGWRVFSVRLVDVGGDHKAVLARVQHKATGRIVRFLVINAMSVSASKSKSSEIFAKGLTLRPHVVMGSECSDFSAAIIDNED